MVTVPSVVVRRAKGRLCSSVERATYAKSSSGSGVNVTASELELIIEQVGVGGLLPSIRREPPITASNTAGTIRCIFNDFVSRHGTACKKKEQFM